MFLTSDQLARRGRLDLSFDLLGILEPERMTELLDQVLARRGWTRTPDGKWARPSANQAIWQIDTGSRVLAIDISPQLAQDIAIDSSRLGIYDDSGPVKVSVEQLPATVRTSIEVALQHLETGEKDRLVAEAMQARQALTAALQEVYREALQEKARAMGNIVSVSESTQDGTTRIRIEIA
ncbi:MAG: hypothetical protein OZSIB_0785 [Candidatus Ozemobacter sibiricus]|jgi:hypothetical protein|uniref:FtsH ternary system domain-containing protein n=1 Tax=Candidatus Ozemobacter sibiricus TaxID=2268124 RepID=A0A367ZWE8_9BACT|nr:MAG: hypothetical protein OZSIB_0785 [Candidatus Ozemobacter sibiricus]